jgi:hypothetical protein
MLGRGLLAALVLLAVPAGYVNAEDVVGHDAFKGTFSCGVTLYILPRTRDETPMVTGQGEMEITADGNGKLVRGTLTERIADDTHRPSGIDVCTFTLISGSYSIDRDGNGTSSARWALGANDTAHCTNFIPGAKFNGIETGRTRAPQGSANATLFFDGKNRSYSVNVVDQGFAVAVCDRKAGD